MGLVLLHCDLGDGEPPVEVRVDGNSITAIGHGIAKPADELLDADGGAVIPGLHDHHIHLQALAAWMKSVPVGPPSVTTADQLAAALRTAPGEGWIRAVGYHDSVAGPVDRDHLDGIVAHRPVRVQHRSGALWILNSAALQLAKIDSDDGRLYRADRDLRNLVPHHPVDLAAVGRLLARRGVTAVTDATVDLGDDGLDMLERAIERGAIPQRLMVLGATPAAGSAVTTGPRKLVLDEARGIDLDMVTEQIARAHDRGRSVAIHCVTVTEVLLAIEAIEQAGSRPGDRLEHASELPRHADQRIRELGISVVTQPVFIAERGDEYLREVEPEHQEILYRCGSLLGGGVPVGGSSDAPFGAPDPWLGMQVAIDRRTRSGVVLGAEERITPRQALNLFLTPLSEPGGTPRSITAGALADLCILDRTLDAALDAPQLVHVRTTIINGQLAHESD